MPSNISSEDCQKANKLLKLITAGNNSTIDIIDKIVNDIKNGTYKIKQGISLLDLKNSTMVEYMANLSYTSLLKLSGKSINGHPVINRLIEDRVIIERLHPYENKLKYQIEKYITDAKNAESGISNTEESLSEGVKINDFAMGNETDAEDEASCDDDDEDGGFKVTANLGDEKLSYKVPKVSQNRFVEENKLEEEEKAQAAKRRLLNSAMMQDALYEHQDDPDVIYNSSSLQRKANKRREEIKKYEEDNFTRISLSKKEKADMRSTYTAGTIHGELLGFSDVGVLDGSSDRSGKKGKKRSRKSSSGKRGKGKKRRL